VAQGYNSDVTAHLASASALKWRCARCDLQKSFSRNRLRLGGRLAGVAQSDYWRSERPDQMGGKGSGSALRQHNYLLADFWWVYSAWAWHQLERIRSAGHAPKRRICKVAVLQLSQSEATCTPVSLPSARCCHSHALSPFISPPQLNLPETFAF